MDAKLLFIFVLNRITTASSDWATKKHPTFNKDFLFPGQIHQSRKGLIKKMKIIKLNYEYRI